MTFCLTRLCSQTDSTIRTYSCTVPEELVILTERINIMTYHQSFPSRINRNHVKSYDNPRRTQLILSLCVLRNGGLRCGKIRANASWAFSTC